MTPGVARLLSTIERLNLDVTVDTREPEHTAWQFGAHVTVTRAKLDTGDYAPTGFEGVCAIERKTLDDLVTCLTWERRRFWAELERFATFEFACIVCEASLDHIAKHRYFSQTHPSAVVGSVCAIHVDFGIPTIWAGSSRAAARMAERLMRKFVERRRAAS